MADAAFLWGWRDETVVGVLVCVSAGRVTEDRKSVDGGGFLLSLLLVC